MDKKDLCKRYILLIIGLFISAFGVAITKRGELGVSPVSSVANVLSYRYPYLFCLAISRISVYGACPLFLRIIT